MNQSIEDRMQAVEIELKEIRKELEESLGKYKDRGWLSVDTPQFIPITPSEFKDKMDKLWENSK
jgi:hypothetical protein